MARILSIQSQVLYGHVGNSAAVFALERLGHEVISVPTTLLSFHPGHGKPSGEAVSAKQIGAWLGSLKKQGVLAKCDAVLTGYFAKADQIAPVAEVIWELKKSLPDLIYFCDPVFGDEKTGRFLPRDVEKAIAKHLLPIADFAAPNRYEMAELTGKPVRDADSASKAAGQLGPGNVFVTSVPIAGQRNEVELGTLYWQRPGEWQRMGGAQKHGSWLAGAPKHKSAPHGVGDLFAALALGHMLNQVPVPAALRRATAAVGDFLATATSENLDELPLVRHQSSFAAPNTHVSLTPLGAGPEGQWVAGVDGCPEGWLVVLKDVAGHMAPRWRVCKTITEVFSLQERPAVIAVDAPIGIPNVAARGGRVCDRAARACIGERRSSVFTPPARPALTENNFHAACEINLKHSIPPRKVSKQAFGIFPQIREVDAAITPADQSRIFECHPEVAFWVMNGERPLHEPKKLRNAPHPDGLALRRGLLVSAGFDVRFIASFDMPRAKAAQDDFLDACACAMTAERIAKGEAIQLPDDPTRDPRGLRMEIWG